MRSSGWIALALALALCERAYGQTVEEARQQMLVHAGRVLPPHPVVAPSLLLVDPAGRERELEDALDLRNRGIVLTALGGGLEGIAIWLYFWAAFAQPFESLGTALCDLSTPRDCKGTDWDAYYRTAGILALIGAVPLLVGVPTLIRGALRVRAARGYAISIAPAPGSGFAAVGAALEF